MPPLISPNHCFVIVLSHEKNLKKIETFFVKRSLFNIADLFFPVLWFGFVGFVDLDRCVE
jgi:hypothetical protein